MMRWVVSYVSVLYSFISTLEVAKENWTEVFARRNIRRPLHNFESS